MGNMPRLMDNKILSRGDLGGISLIVSGSLGSGKTSLIMHILKVLMKKRHEKGRPSQERFFWRGRATCQWAKFQTPRKILAQEDAELEFYTDGETQDFDIVRFNTFSDIWKLTDKHHLNVVYLPIKRFIDFIEWVQQEVFDWTTFIIDECSDIAPYGASGDKYEWCQRVADILKETRKNRISILANTQDFSDIQWFALRKFMAYAFLRGSRPVKTQPVWDRAIRGLDVGEAWVSMGNQYEKIQFPPYKGKDIRAKIKYI